jgi:ribosomal-protein-alanine N-acetyltransferase
MTPEDVSARLMKEIRTHQDLGIQYWPIFLRETDEFVGCCGLRPHGEDEKTLEMGVHLVKEQWGKGLATEACAATMEYAFRQLHVRSLFAGHNPNNHASERMIRGLGFIRVGEEYYPSTGLMHPSYRLEQCRH